MSLFIRSMMNFWSERDAEFIIKTYADALIQQTYYGDIDTLSARSCHPIADIFRKVVLRSEDEEPDRCRTRAGEDALKTLFGSGSSSLTFADGMSSFPETLAKYLTASDRYTYIDSKVSSAANGTVVANGKEFTADIIISTLPSFELQKILPYKIPEVTHNSVLSVNLGFNTPLSVNASSYCVPTRL